MQFIEHFFANQNQTKMALTNAIRDLYIPSYKHLEGRNFREVCQHLEGGGIAYLDYLGNTSVIFRQIPSIVPATIVPKMSSVPQSVKELIEYRNNISNSNRGIDYENQWIEFNLSNHQATYYVPNVSEINSKEWVLIFPEQVTQYPATPKEAVVAKSETVGTAKQLEKEFPPHVLRVVDEHLDLSEKIVKLREFTINPKFRQISGDLQADLLIRQLEVMVLYQTILEKRLIDFGYLNKEENQ